MPIPFKDLREKDLEGAAGYLRFVEESARGGLRGALFLVNSRGEPIEFTFARVDLPRLSLWRSSDSRRNAAANLTVALFGASQVIPRVLLALTDEVDQHLLLDDIQVDIPVCRVQIGELIRSPTLRIEQPETVANSVHLFWVTESPGDGSSARLVMNSLLARNLLTEPFERALAGVAEAFGD